VTERSKFIIEARGGLFSHTELCRRRGISRQKGYKWLETLRARGTGRAARSLALPALMRLASHTPKRHPRSRRSSHLQASQTTWPSLLTPQR
jgi:hypothetical protein